jgi:pimeloyl-ACP methyl ester carboxylesterase
MLAHGLTATRRYVLHGSSALARNGHRLISYDACSHGSSDPGPQGGHTYELLRNDLLAVAATECPDGKPVLVGHSMGAHTVASALLDRPEDFAAAVIIGPVYRGIRADEATLDYWRGLASGLESGGVDGFMAAYGEGSMDPDWRETILRITRDRLSLHAHPEAVAMALREIPADIPFGQIDELAAIGVPVLVVASHDVADPSHPYESAAAYAEAIPGATLISEAEGESPLAWQGGKLSREISAFLDGLPRL